MLLAVAFAEAVATSLTAFLFVWSVQYKEVDADASSDCFLGGLVLGLFVIFSSGCVIMEKLMEWGVIA